VLASARQFPQLSLKSLLDVLSRQATRLSSWKWLLTTGALFAALTAAFEWRRAVVDAALLDGRVFQRYSPADVGALFKQLSDAGTLWLYFYTEITLDLLYPFVYAALFLGAIRRLFPAARKTLLLPVVACVCDLGENLLIAFMAYTWQGDAPDATVVGLASGFTFAKWVTTGLALLVVLGATGLRLLSALDGILRRLAASPPNTAGVGDFAAVTQRELEYVTLRRRHNMVPASEHSETSIGL
jgi:hypothetical protein